MFTKEMLHRQNVQSVSAPADKFKEQAGDKVWAAEHVVGVAQGVSEDILADLQCKLRRRML